MEKTWSLYLSAVAVVVSLAQYCFIPCLALNNIVPNYTTDQSALLAFKSHIVFNNPHHILANNWSSATSICDWIGVSCGKHHHRVTTLNLPDMGIGGTIPPHIGNLSFLSYFNITNNNFHGHLPSELARLHRLNVVDFGINNFDGGVPTWFGNLPELQYLILRNNSFNGPVPSSIGNISELELLDLRYNLLEGSVPEEIGNLGKLKWLKMAYNYLSGSIPATIFNLSSLETIDFTTAFFSGSLPEDICVFLPKLKFLLLSVNEFEGQIPSNLGECRQLRGMSLSYNKFTGFIPKAIGNLTLLQTLYIGDNYFKGNDLKKVLTSTDDAILSEIKTALKYFGRQSLQKQGRAAHVLLRYDPTYTTFSASKNIPIPEGEEFLTALILTDFRNLSQTGCKGSDLERSEVANSAKSDQSETEVEEALKLAFEEADLNSADPPSTSGQEDRALDDIFHDLEDLPGAFPEDMAELSLTKLAKKANAERLATQRRAEEIRTTESQSQSSLPVIERTAKNGSAEAEPFVQASVQAEQRLERRPVDVHADSEEDRADKRPCLDESDVIVPFVIQPKIKNTPTSCDASVIKDPAVALSLATSVSLPADNVAFWAEPDLVAIGLTTQSALLAVGRIADVGRRYHDAVELIGRLQAKVEGQRSRAQSKGARAEAETERARNAEELRSVAKKGADASDDALKLAQEAISKLEAGLEEMKAVKETTDLKVSSAFDAGRKSTFDEYVDEVPKFENWGFKHGWVKALAVANVSLAMPIPYEQIDVEPLESDSEG